MVFYPKFIPNPIWDISPKRIIISKTIIDKEKIEWTCT